MTQRRNGHGFTTRVLSASTIAVFLLAAAPAEAGWLGRGIAVGGVGYSLKKNIGELIDDAGEVLSAAVEGDMERVEGGFKEVRRFPIKLIVDAFPVLRIGSEVAERVASAKARVKGLFNRAGKASYGPGVALLVKDEEELKVLGGRRLPVVRPRHFALSGGGSWEPSEESRGESDKGLSQVPGGDQAPADHAAEGAGLGLTAEGKVLVQTGLAAMNYEVGPADGIFGKKTRSAIRAWQEAQGSAGTGYLTKEQAEALRQAGTEARHAARERERKEREKAEEQRAAREAAERKRLAREGREKNKEGGLVEAVSALTEVEAKNCVVWKTRGMRRRSLGYWKGPCKDGLAFGKGSAVMTAYCASTWLYIGGCSVRDQDQVQYYEGSAKHGLSHGRGVLQGTGRSNDEAFRQKTYVQTKWSSEGEFYRGSLVNGTTCSGSRCDTVNYELPKIEEEDPTCKFWKGEEMAVFWLGSCVGGLASGPGVAVSRNWIFVGEARDGRANGQGQLTEYLDIDVNADPVNLWVTHKTTYSDSWRNGQSKYPGEVHPPLRFRPNPKRPWY